MRKQGVSVDEIERVLLSYVPGEFIDLEHGALGYAHQRLGPLGSRVFWDERRPEVHVQLKGEWCSALGEPEMRGLLTWARSRVSSVSRLDVFGDDERKRVTPAEVKERMHAELVTHSQVRNWHENLSAAAGLQPDGHCLGGSTLSFGQRGSRQFLRVYDKTAESHGEIDAIRWEFEARNEAAMALLQVLPTVKGWGQIWADAVSSFVDFRERWRLANVSECPRSPWFDALVADVEKWCPYPAKAPRTIGQVFDFLARFMGPSFWLMLAAAEGDVSILEELALAGRDRLKRSQRVMLAEYLAREAA